MNNLKILSNKVSKSNLISEGIMISRIVYLSCVVVLTTVFCIPITAQNPRKSSYVTKTGEKVLRFETIIAAPSKIVWRAFTEEKSLSSWIAPVASIEMKIGGNLSANFDKNAKLGDSGTIYSRIINYIEDELITFKVELTNEFQKKAQEEDQDLQEIIQIIDLGKGTTKVVSSTIGWGKGKEWDEAYNILSAGNEWTYQQLVKFMAKRTLVKTKKRKTK